MEPSNARLHGNGDLAPAATADAGRDDAVTRPQQTARTTVAVAQAVEACALLGEPGSSGVRRLLFMAGAPRSRAGALAPNSLHRRFYLNVTACDSGV